MDEALRYKSEGRGLASRWYHWNFSLTEFFRPNYGNAVDLAHNRNEYPEYFLGGKGGRCLGLTTLPPSWPTLSKSGSLNLLESSGRAIRLYRDRFTSTFAFITLWLMRRSQWMRSLTFHANFLSFCSTGLNADSPFLYFCEYAVYRPSAIFRFPRYAGRPPSPPVFIFNHHPIVGSKMKILLPSANMNHCFTHLKSLMIM